MSNLDLNGDIWSESSEFGSAFQYKSIFKYSKLPTDDNEFDQYVNDERDKFSAKQNFMRNIFIIIAYLLLIFTFPITGWFFVKRVKPLERCIVHRLGKRLPIRGPGLIIKLPFIDVIDFVDLQASTICINENKTLLTSDRSIIECTNLEIEINVLNIIKSFAKLKDSRKSVERFIKAAFPNMISSSHIEDIEYKLDFVIKRFIQSCNTQINDWGWNATLIKLPNVKIIERSDPTNPLIQALKGYFTSGNSQSPNTQIINSPTITVVQDPNDDDLFDDLLSPLQAVAHKYTKLKYLGYKEVNISITINSLNTTKLYQFDVESGEMKKIQSGKIHVEIIAKTLEDFNQFIQTEDTTKVTLNTTLF